MKKIKTSSREVRTTFKKEYEFLVKKGFSKHAARAILHASKPKHAPKTFRWVSKSWKKMSSEIGLSKNFTEAYSEWGANGVISLGILEVIDQSFSWLPDIGMAEYILNEHSLSLPSSDLKELRHILLGARQMVMSVPRNTKVF